MFQHDRATFDTAFAAAPIAADAADGGAIGRFLRAARAHLHLEVAYVSEIIGNESVFRHVDAPGRAGGMRLAVDDAGSGYAGLQQILSLRPDIIKLDRFFVREIDRDPVRRALAAALAEFSAQVGCQIVAEGVEEDAELEVLRTLGFQTIQGYLLGRPGTVAAAQALASSATVAA